MLAEVRSLGSAVRLRGPEELQDLEQELVDQYALAALCSGLTDDSVAADRSVLFEFVRFLGRPVWTATTADADRFFVGQRRRGLSKATMRRKASVIAMFFDFVIARYQGDVHALTGYVVASPIDEFNRPASALASGSTRVPPRVEEVEVLFDGWRRALPETRKYLTAARNYMAASLWRRVGLRINESVMLDIGDWRPDLGEHGKLHIRFGKGARGRGPKTRLVPAIDSVDALMGWWLTEVRHQFGDDWADPHAPLLPSERYDAMTGRCTRAGGDTVRNGFTEAVATWLPAWQGRLTPHGMRHFCASSLYGRGVDIRAIQDLLGHGFLSTTTNYIHVHDAHIEIAWAAANERVAARLSLGG